MPHHYERRELERHYNLRTACAGLRCINSLHSPEVADALRSVAHVLAFLVNPEGCLFITQILLQLVLGCSI